MKRSLFGAAALAVVALSAVLIGTASAAKPPSAPNNTCPTNAKNASDLEHRRRVGIEHRLDEHVHVRVVH